mmetsp:Transcript_1702/g.5135  ORF Transcript_1702/g.5135 Transcript_1702/m.5135 type:complete len:328 (-) Transcript_1702:288-1271(-)
MQALELVHIVVAYVLLPVSASVDVDAPPPVAAGDSHCCVQMSCPRGRTKVGHGQPHVDVKAKLPEFLVEFTRSAVAAVHRIRTEFTANDVHGLLTHYCLVSLQCARNLPAHEHGRPHKILAVQCVHVRLCKVLAVNKLEAAQHVHLLPKHHCCVLAPSAGGIGLRLWWSGPLPGLEIEHVRVIELLLPVIPTKDDHLVPKYHCSMFGTCGGNLTQVGVGGVGLPSDRLPLSLHDAKLPHVPQHVALLVKSTENVQRSTVHDHGCKSSRGWMRLLLLVGHELCPLAAHTVKLVHRVEEHVRWHSTGCQHRHATRFIELRAVEVGEPAK